MLRVPRGLQDKPRFRRSVSITEADPEVISFEKSNPNSPMPRSPKESDRSSTNEMETAQSDSDVDDMIEEDPFGTRSRYSATAALGSDCELPSIASSKLAMRRGYGGQARISGSPCLSCSSTSSDMSKEVASEHQALPQSLGD
mmetsp:Transcript_19648/g.34814  ORF Transcript_19648/g.34814 Transcript_19648/m.34814 type:complete len:143 (-) Transcript_19648:271-699(-)|eukprot:CAMPEP_0197627982 /NCGR_PEP_ID=MMETSP1338-20131121/6434_1 /TAXON_ID=43686 ORGANISM="Pelagodinium beii, Strain RCC1491" /NCGR_SAMPLE_ID=MMETSP1338 /ASSEMBLY_ACC=CAM_ASM_000754 /LENGTH=142 /DNA_ID=CAMNT_0043198845 /DNA_START=84 /DNA_END=512 /DNA_ORIENTATION=+